MYRSCLLASVLIWPLSTVPAFADCEIISADDPQAVRAALSSLGPAELTRDRQGDPLIAGTSGEQSYVVYFYGCSEGERCVEVQFSAGFTTAEPVPLSQINAWNHDNRYGRAYLAPDGAAIVEMDVNLDGGICAETFADTADYWRLVLEAFPVHIGF